jgi:hypothetical protein
MLKPDGAEYVTLALDSSGLEGAPPYRGTLDTWLRILDLFIVTGGMRGRQVVEFDQF